MQPALPRAPAAAHESASPVVAAVGPGQQSPRPVPLPAQQVQAAAVAGRHAEGPIGTQHLARRAIAAGPAVPHAVLGGRKGGLGSAGDRAKGARRGALGSGHRAMGKDEGKEARDEGGRGGSCRALVHRHYIPTQFLPPLLPSAEVGRGDESLRMAARGGGGRGVVLQM